MKRIDSRSNSLYRAWKSLLAAKGIKEEGALLVSGRKLVPEFLASNDLRLQHLLVSDPKDVEKLSFKKTLEVTWLAKDMFDEIDEAGTHFPMLVVEAPSLPRSQLDRPPQGLEVVLALSNPLNMGAALRSCEAFGVTHATILRECAHPFLPKVLRSSSGSSLRVRLSIGPSITDLTEKETRLMTALDMVGESLTTARLPENLRLFIGEEGRGVPENLNFEQRICIPIKPGMDSLNAVAATSVALYAYRAKNPL